MLRLAAVLTATLMLSGKLAGATEEPEYTVVEKDGAFELRQYPALLAAETLVTGTDFDAAGNVAFGRLFRYISGNNRGRAEIAMTSPVVQSRDGQDRDGESIAMTAPVIQQAGKPGDASGGYKVAFLVPAQYTRETVPEPLDPSVRIVATPARLIAALRYPGRMSEALHGKQELALRAELVKRKLAIGGEVISAQYDAPFIPGPFRRNEVLIPVGRE